jgi:hypothetical protein
VPSNPKKPGSTASQSFKPQEVEAALQLFRAAGIYPQLASLMNNEAMLGVRRKFVRMRARMDHDRLELDVDYWLARLHETVDGFEIMNPKDPRNPMPGQYTVAGRYHHRSSMISLHHAAVLFLGQVMRDSEALEALKRS